MANPQRSATKYTGNDIITKKLEELENLLEKMKKVELMLVERYKNLDSRVQKLRAVSQRILEKGFPELQNMVLRMEKLGREVSAPSPAVSDQFDSLRKRLSDFTSEILDDIDREKKSGSSGFWDLVGEKLISAILDGKPEEVRRLLEAGADINYAIPDIGMTPLHYAAIYDNEDTIAVLLENGADCNVKSPNEQTPLHMASYSIEGRSVPLLAGAGAVVNSQDNAGNTPLHVAASYNRTVVRKLLAANADKTIKNNEGKMPFEVATKSSLRRLLRS